MQAHVTCSCRLDMDLLSVELRAGPAHRIFLVFHSLFSGLIREGEAVSFRANLECDLAHFGWVGYEVFALIPGDQPDATPVEDSRGRELTAAVLVCATWPTWRVRVARLRLLPRL